MNILDDLCHGLGRLVGLAKVRYSYDILIVLFLCVFLELVGFHVHYIECDVTLDFRVWTRLIGIHLDPHLAHPSPKDVF